jgi:dihydroneopterin aldolase
MHEEISLQGMRFHTRVGILPHEREHPQALVVDLTVWRIPQSAGEDVLDYRKLYELVAGRVAGGAVEYLETAAHAIAAAALRERGVSRVRVTLRKPQVLLPGPLDAAVVTVDRSGTP